MACSSSNDESECVFNSTTDRNAMRTMSAYGFNTIQPRPYVELSDRRSPTWTEDNSGDEIDYLDSGDEIERTSFREKFLPTNDLTDRRSPTLQESLDAQLAFDLQTKLDKKDKKLRTMFREPFRVPDPLTDTVNSETGWDDCEYIDDKSFAEKLQREEDAESARRLQENDVVHGRGENRRHSMHPCLRAQVIGGLGQIPASLERRRGVNNPEPRVSSAPSHQQRSHGNNNSITGASLRTEHNLLLQNRQGIQNHMVFPLAANPRISREVPLHNPLRQLFNIQNGQIEVDGVNGGVNNEMTYEQILDLEDQLGEVKFRGLKERDIQNIPQYPYQPASESKGDHSLCCICRERMERGENVRQLPCTHKYHQPCIDKWLQRKAECPECRTQL